MKKVLLFTAAAEAATGMGLLVAPSLVAWLLLGQELSGVAVPVARVAGLALIGLGIACWPGMQLAGILTYSATVALYLAYAGLVGGFTGILLWPAILVHAVLSILLARELWFGSSR